MLSFLTRITKTPSQILLYQSCNVIVGVMGFVSVLAVTVGCRTSSGTYLWLGKIGAALKHVRILLGI